MGLTLVQGDVRHPVVPVAYHQMADRMCRLALAINHAPHASISRGFSTVLVVWRLDRDRRL